MMRIAARRVAMKQKKPTGGRSAEWLRHHEAGVEAQATLP